MSILYIAFMSYVLSLFFKFLFYVFIGTGIGLILYALYKFYNTKKANYVLNNIKNLSKIEYTKTRKKYKTIYEETGYSSNWKYRTTHYKAKIVPKPIVYKVTAYFKCGKIVKFSINENHEVCNILINK